MPNYTYKGLNNSGKTVSGQINAEDEKTAVAQIKALGIYPTDVHAGKNGHASSSQTKSGTSSGFRLNRRAGSADLTVFSRQLANLVAGGLPLMRTFAALTEHTENLQMKTALTRMQQEVQGGKSLWEALAMHPRIFPPLYVSMVKAGEASGQLSSVLEWLAQYLEKEQSRKMQIRSALAYPTLLVTVGTLAVFALITLVVPRFVNIFEEFEQALPMPTVILLNISGFVSHWWWLVIGLVVGVITGVRQYSKTPNGRLKLDALKLKMPLFGKLNMKSAISRFARTTAILLQGGVPLLDSMTVVREVVGNEILARGADQVREGMKEGSTFTDRLKQSGVFPPLLIHMVGVGEETGDLQNVLMTVANSYDVEVDATLKSVVSLLEPVIIMTIGGIITFIILAMLLPVFQINLMAG